MKIVVLLFIIAIVASLFFAMRAMIRPNPQAPERTARALTIRIGLSLALFILLMLGYQFGLLTPGQL